MTEHSQSILVERDDPYTFVTLNRPKVLNALNNQVVSELASALEAFDRENEIRCMVITGAGEKAFAAGSDIKEMSDKSPIAMMLGGIEAWQRIRQIQKPLIAAVGGYALGEGCELAMHCDMIVASENARFGQPEILLGIIPGAGGTQRLARAIGKFRTMEMVLTGVQIPAQELRVLEMKRVDPTLMTQPIPSRLTRWKKHLRLRTKNSITSSSRSSCFKKDTAFSEDLFSYKACNGTMLSALLEFLKQLLLLSRRGWAKCALDID